MIWWWELGYKDGQTPDSIIKFGCEVNVRSIHEEEDSITYICSLISWCNLNCDIFYYFTFTCGYDILTWLLVFGFDFGKMPRSTTKKELFCTADSRFSSNFSFKDSN